MLAAEHPFDDVDLIVVTHDHLDHFNAALVLAYMQSNPRCRLIGTEQVKERLKKRECFESIEKRVHAVTPPKGGAKNVSVNGVEVEVLRLKHCAYHETDEATGEKIDRHRNEQNIGVVVCLGGNRILHIGDSAMDDVEEYMNFDLVPEKIDIAMLGSIFWPPFSKRVELVNKAIQPKRIIAMHLDQGSKDKYFTYREAMQKELPPITIFKKSLDSMVYAGD